MRSRGIERRRGDATELAIVKSLTERLDADGGMFGGRKTVATPDHKGREPMTFRAAKSHTGPMQRVPSPVQCRDTQRRTGCVSKPVRRLVYRPLNRRTTEGNRCRRDGKKTTRRTPEPVRADAEGDGADGRQHRRETMATPDHRGQNPMMFAQLEPIQAKAEGTFAGSMPGYTASRGLRSNPCDVCVSPVEPAKVPFA